MQMRRLALLPAGGALWLFVAALPTLADGGPHMIAANSGTGGASTPALAGDCAACHRAHTAKAADLLKDEMPGLCTNCHNGTGATTDVLDGYQFVPDGTTGNPTGTVLGALRGGGFNYALIDSSSAARIINSRTTLSRGHVGVLATTVKQAATSAHSGTGTVWGNGPNSASPNVGATGVDLECTGCHNPHGNGQYRILNTTPGASWTNGATSAATSLATPIGAGATTIAVASAADFPAYGPYTVAIESEQMLVTAGQGTTSWTVVRGAGGTTAAAHAAGAGVVLKVTGWTAPTNAVEIQDGPAFSTDTAVAHPVRNYTVLPGDFADQVVTAGYTPAQGDYWRRQVPFWDTSTARDPMQTGWDGESATNAASYGGVPPSNSTGLMTAWCISCHTRYSGVPDLIGQLPSDSYPSGDAIYSYRHDTDGIAGTGCLQCHVSHGSNAVMSAQFSQLATDPSGALPPLIPNAGTGTQASGDSKLLKVDNRGTCQVCHDPTGTAASGSYAGPTPRPIAP
jgi:predicted CXXCH cytochrome family protein